MERRVPVPKWVSPCMEASAAADALRMKPTYASLLEEAREEAHQAPESMPGMPFGLPRLPTTSTPTDDSFMLFAFLKVEQSSRALQALQVRVKTWEARIQQIQQSVMVLIDRANSAADAAEPVALGAGRPASSSSMGSTQQRVKAVEDRIRQLLRLIHDEHSSKLVELQHATYVLQSKLSSHTAPHRALLYGGSSHHGHQASSCVAGLNMRDHAATSSYCNPGLEHQ
mmetsp:Transcript_54738/g.123222  ORF Transcript_54738/g.123222 Transcript_54738/m.123222 type:complete len:227 (-) Transcript_54738:188-868(-)